MTDGLKLSQRDPLVADRSADSQQRPGGPWQNLLESRLNPAAFWTFAAARGP
jgi:hypothetical protein